MDPNFVYVKASSLDGSSDVLIELTGLLDAGRPETGLTRTLRQVAHDDVVRKLDEFAAFAENQYQDAVALLAGLSGKLQSRAAIQRKADATIEANVYELLTTSVFKPGN